MKASFQKWALAGLVVYSIFITLVSVNKNEYVQAKEIELKRAEKRLRLKDDSIRQIIQEFHRAELRQIKVMQDAEIRANIAEIKAEKAVKQYEKVVFKSFANDTARARAISNLYPSFRPR